MSEIKKMFYIEYETKDGHNVSVPIFCKNIYSLVRTKEFKKAIQEQCDFGVIAVGHKGSYVGSIEVSDGEYEFGIFPAKFTGVKEEK